ncbi:MAG: dTDP-4-dehydrorhamnose 3,5-epimerase [Chthoniobacterales bacterium]
MDALNDLAGVMLTPLRIVEGESGRVLHALRSDKPGFAGFGEAYFSTVAHGAVKGWKKHRDMVLNLVVPMGSIRFCLFDERGLGDNGGVRWSKVDLGVENYQRLTVPEGVWVAFRGLGPGENWLLNVASVPHEPNEAEALPLDDAKFSMVDLRT